MFGYYYENEVEACKCCGEPTLGRAVGVGPVCETCNEDEEED